MANINISVDTETKAVSVTVNNQVIPEVNNVNLYVYREDGEIYGMDMTISVRQLIEDVLKEITYYAYGSEKCEKVEKNSCEVYNDIAGFVGIETYDQAIIDVNEFFDAKRRH